MTRLATGKKSKKTQSEFQKLWAKAEKLKQENARFRDRLDDIIQRIQTDIGPVEEAAATQQIPLLKRLLALGQRRSLLQWQRQALDDWIREILEPLMGIDGLEHDVLEELSRYDAFRLGIELDETSSIPLQDQLRTYFEQEQLELQGESQDWQQQVHRDVEKILEQTLGPEPIMPEQHGENADDLFGNELIYEQQRQYDADVKARNAAREELLEKMFATGGFSENDEDDRFDFGPDPFDFDSAVTEEDESEVPAAISNVVFKRLFRSIAARLHPDRERDPDKREKKHTLMTRLLDARNQGDVMTIVLMYQEHVGEDATLSKLDEKQLLQALKGQIDELRYEQEDYSLQSPLHRMAYEQFYSTHREKTNRAFKQHIRKIENTGSEACLLALEITSLRALKPHLELRYDERSISALEAFFDFR